LLADTVTAREISNSVALTQAGGNITRIVAPLTGGALFQLLGPSGSYVCIGLVYASGVATALAIATRPRAATLASRPSVWRSMGQGLSYVRREGVLVASLLMAGIANLTGFPFDLTVMPVYARDVLHTSSTGLGMLLSCIGIGSLVGSMTLAAVPDLKYTGRWMIAGMVGWHLTCVAVAFSHSFAVAVVPLVLMGVCQSLSMITISALLLGKAPAEYRGRVMGLRMLAVYPLAFGSPVSGALLGSFGVGGTVPVMAAFGILLILALWWRVPRLGARYPTQDDARVGLPAPVA
jgi:hypothetical protein